MPGISAAGAAARVPHHLHQGPHERRRTRGVDHDPAGGLKDAIDYEGELGVIVGRRTPPGAIVDETSAWDAVFGFTIINDVTARDVQKQHQQWYLGKSFDTFCPMGPWIVPKTRCDLRRLRIGRRRPAAIVKRGVALGTVVNGERRQASDTSAMLFDGPRCCRW